MSTTKSLATGGRSPYRGGVQWRGKAHKAVVAGAVVAVAAAIAMAVLVLPARLVERDLGDRRMQALDEPELLKAQNDIRTTLLQGLAGGFLFVGLYLTYRTIQVNREGQITERFTRAIDQLGSKDLEVKLGGIYALERIAKDSSNDHGPVMEVLTAFLREHTPHDSGREGQPGAQVPEETTTAESPRRPRVDLQAAMTVVGRRNARNDPPNQKLDLSRVRLPSGDLRHANLQGANLYAAKLGGAFLSHANLQGANLFDADLELAFLNNTNLQGANLFGTNLKWALLSDTNLQGARATVETKWSASFDPEAAGVVIEKVPWVSESQQSGTDQTTSD